MGSRLEYYETSDSELSEEIVKEYKQRNMKLIELIDELDMIAVHDVNTDFTEREQGLRLDILKIMIAQKIDIKGAVHYFVDSVDEILEKMQKQIDAIEKYSNHRHKTIMGLYTEKAVY